jgi:glutamyl-tRNA synthetase
MSDATKRPVRVRVAPSPTGDPHVGTAYIALFNYAFARHNGGKFLLRIEDTDRERSTLKSEQAILDSLRWIGLAWDEGPDVGGPFGPYRQSERSDIYRKWSAELVARRAAYPCFCTAERLDALRREQRAKKMDFGYDGACRNLPEGVVREKLSAEAPHVIRLAVPREGETRVQDLLRGEVVFQNSGVDDQVLLKSDGFPTYHLANVVDDHLMEITHVIRAEEWISSTPKHVLLYRAFGWEPPAFVHMPLLRDRDKSKISKRRNPTSLLWYREQGYLPEALLNFLGLIGWSMPDEREVFSLDEMVREFSWERVSTSGPVFDLQKLDWLNGVYIRKLAPDELAKRTTNYVLRPETGHYQMQGQPVELARTIPLVQERMKKLGDWIPLTRFLFSDVSPSPAELVPKRCTPEEARKCLEAAIEALQSEQAWAADALEARCRALAGMIPMKEKDIFMCIRVAVTGTAVSPPLFQSMELLGRERTLARLRAGCRLLSNPVA